MSLKRNFYKYYVPIVIVDKNAYIDGKKIYKLNLSNVAFIFVVRFDEVVQKISPS